MRVKNFCTRQTLLVENACETFICFEKNGDTFVFDGNLRMKDVTNISSSSFWADVVLKAWTLQSS